MKEEEGDLEAASKIPRDYELSQAQENTENVVDSEVLPSSDEKEKLTRRPSKYLQPDYEESRKGVLNHPKASKVPQHYEYMSNSEPSQRIPDNYECMDNPKNKKVRDKDTTQDGDKPLKPPSHKALPRIPTEYEEMRDLDTVSDTRKLLEEDIYDKIDDYKDEEEIYETMI